MPSLKIGILTLAFAAFVCESSAFAQYGMGGMGGMGGGMGGMGGGGMMGRGMARPKRRLHKSKAPVLSPALNLLPEVSSTFEGQFLMRQLPQEQVLQNQRQTGKALDKLQNELTDSENQVKFGTKKTGHKVRFMDYGNYYNYSSSVSGSTGR